MIEYLNNFFNSTWTNFTRPADEQENRLNQLVTPLIFVIGTTIAVVLHKTCKALEKGDLRNTRFQKFGYERVKGLDGDANVYFNPNDPRYLFKYKLGMDISNRLMRMEQARSACEKIGSKQLVIPNAWQVEDALKEERLPITHYKCKEQIGLYLENLEHFTPAIKEFTRLLCVSEFADLIDGKNRGLKQLSTVKTARVDNVPLYLVEENGVQVGKIGLIDLEHFSFKGEKQSKENVLEACLTAVTFFPHHVHSILEAATEFDPEIEKYRGELQAKADQMLDFFEKAYVVHKGFLEKNRISIANPQKLVEIRPEVKQAIIEELQKKWTELNDDSLPTRSLFSDVIDLIDQFNKIVFQKALKKSGDPQSMPKLLELRTCEFCRTSIQWGFDNTLIDGKTQHDRIVDLVSSCNLFADRDTEERLALWLGETIYQLLVEKGVVAGYIKNWYGMQSSVFF